VNEFFTDVDKIGDKVENFLILLKSVFDVSRETPKKVFFPKCG